MVNVNGKYVEPDPGELSELDKALIVNALRVARTRCLWEAKQDAKKLRFRSARSWIGQAGQMGSLRDRLKTDWGTADE